MGHDTYNNIQETEWSARTLTLKQLLQYVKEDMGEGAVVDIDRDIVTGTKCKCGFEKELFMPLHRLVKADVTCEECGKVMVFDTFHSLDGSENFLDKTVCDIEIPPFHILAGRKDSNIIYYEFTKDAEEILHGLL